MHSAEESKLRKLKRFLNSLMSQRTRGELRGEFIIRLGCIGCKYAGIGVGRYDFGRW